jgi:hypothetical protein
MGQPETVVTAAELAEMTPQERSDLVAASTVTRWDEVPEPFRSFVQDTARVLGEQRRSGG